MGVVLVMQSRLFIRRLLRFGHTGENHDARPDLAARHRPQQPGREADVSGSTRECGEPASV